MAKISCKMCGGHLELPAGITSAECPFCGMALTFPKLSGSRQELLYNRAEHFRRICDFDRAVSCYEDMIREAPDDPEAYWGLVLSRFGIEYVKDPVSGERIPTCHRVQQESILSDPDYRQALEYAGCDRDLYEEQAQRIAEIQKDILRISSQEKPYDVFICCKETTDGGTRTPDSVLAQDIYYQLTNEGYKVFFARITLEDKLGTQYEPYIFAALNSAKVMLAIGTKKEHFEAVWVKNEWSRFWALMKRDRSKMLIPCYRDMDPYDLPEALSMLQSQDMSRIGFIQDLLHGIRKILSAPPVPADPAPVPEPEVEDASPNPLFAQAYAAMEAGDWEAAKELVEELLEEEPHNGYSHFYRLMMECRRDFCAIPDISRQHSFRLAKKYADETLSNTLKEIENVRRQWKQELAARPDRWEELEQELIASSADGKDRALLQYVLDLE